MITIITWNKHFFSKETCQIEIFLWSIFNHNSWGDGTHAQNSMTFRSAPYKNMQKNNVIERTIIKKDCGFTTCIKYHMTDVLKWTCSLNEDQYWTIWFKAMNKKGSDSIMDSSKCVISSLSVTLTQFFKPKRSKLRSETPKGHKCPHMVYKAIVIIQLMQNSWKICNHQAGKMGTFL